MPSLRFNSRIYKKKAVYAAVQAYSQLAKFKVNDRKGYIEVGIGGISPEIKDRLPDEFANYVLGMVKNAFSA